MDTRIPLSTYRLQMNSQFGFSEACTLVPYLATLGISDIYLSPILKSQQGSQSGYDIVDFTQINSELGTEAEFDLLVREIQKYGMGILLDLVPNHMAMTSENPFWMDVLEYGLSSPYASVFDVEWTPCNGYIKNQVLLPLLGKPYGHALEDGEITLRLEDSHVSVHYGSHTLPLSLRSYITICSFRLESLEAELGSEHPGVKGFKEIIWEIGKMGSPEFDYYPEDAKVIKGKIYKLFESDEIKHFIRDNIALINGEKGDGHSFDILDEILNQQVYRLAYWRTGREELNYRRFFDINNLIGIKVELPEVHETSHSLILRMIKEGKIDGLRIDHIDGLWDPLEYLTRLHSDTGGLYTVVEKILTGDETLNPQWPVNGTTGYDFAREVNNLFIDNQGLRKIDIHYSRMIGRRTDFFSVVYEKKKQIIQELFSGELHSLACRLHHLAGEDRYARDLSEIDLVQALIEVTANLPVYRTYIHSFEIFPADRQYLETAINGIRSHDVRLEETALQFLRRILLLEFPDNFQSEQKKNWLYWVMKWQQFTGPVTAKGLEDTALYNYNRLVSLNVIGAPLQSPELSIDKFHKFNVDRIKHWPSTMNATSTHDTKRSEDVSAAINVISEKTRDWVGHLYWWRKNNHKKKEVLNGQEIPSPNMEEFIYQTLLGAYPLNEQEVPEFKERFKRYVLKAEREAKTATSWLNPDENYESAVLSFLDGILTESESNEFFADFNSFRKQIAFFGALNSLGQVLLKITSPGIPDFYQGSELWKYDLVDPDNRRPVDFHTRVELLSSLVQREQEDRPGLIHDLLKNWQDGRIKLYLTYKALNFRRKNSELLLKGDYWPLHIEGKRSEHVVVFTRRWEKRWVIVAAPRLNRLLVDPWDFPLDRHTWGKDKLVLPGNAPSNWVNVFTGETLNLGDETFLQLAQIFNTFPEALLSSV